MVRRDTNRMAERDLCETDLRKVLQARTIVEWGKESKSGDRVLKGVF